MQRTRRRLHHKRLQPTGAEPTSGNRAHRFEVMHERNAPNFPLAAEQHMSGSFPEANEVCSRYRRRNCIRQTSRAIGQLCPLVPCNAAVFYLDADFLLQSFESKTPPNCFPHHQHRYGYFVQCKWQAAWHTDASSDL